LPARFKPANSDMNIFERCALGSVGALVIGLVAYAAQTPIDDRTTAPHPVFEPMAVSIPLAPRPVAKAEIAPVRKLTPAQSSHTVKTLSSQFAKLGYDLDSVSAGREEVPRVILASIPEDLKDVREVKVRKAIFFKTVLPLVLQVNEEISAERDRLWQVRFDKSMGRKLDAVDRLWLAVMSDKYKVKRGDIDALMQRVDIVPPSLALAQAAEESGWGTSRFAREGNAIFGQWTYSKKVDGIKPLEREEGQSHRIRAFDSLLDSVRAYARNLNTHRAYRAFRKERATLRRGGKPIDGLRLTTTLTSYSERGEDYVRTLRTIMSANALEKFDKARLRDSDDIGLRLVGEPDRMTQPQSATKTAGSGPESTI